VLKTNETICRLSNLDGIDILECLGTRNLSGMIGEIFGKNLVHAATGLIKNPHPDGYPDILVLDEIGKEYMESVPHSKKKFSPFLTGGFEIKATCGNVGSKGSNDFRQTRHSSRFDWKAHHRQTNHLIGIQWDFIHTEPVIIGIYYSNNLNPEDWGDVVPPKQNGSRTTSVSVMKASGLRKMKENRVLKMNTP
jgi:hypothetical protein